MLFKNFNEIANNGRNAEIKKARKDVLNIFSDVIKSVNPYEKSIKKTTGRDIKFIFVCVFPDGIMHFLAYVRPVTI